MDKSFRAPLMKTAARPALKSSFGYRVHPKTRFCAQLTTQQTPQPSARQSTVCHANSTTNVAASAWQRYCYALLTNPLETKAATSFVGFVLGDVLAQHLEGHGTIDPFRMARLGMYGLILDGPVGHIWYKWLDSACDKVFTNPRGLRAVLTKTAADQLVWAPVMTCVFFAVLKALEGHPEQMLPTIQSKVFPTLVANYALWPLAHFISFKYVPGEQRILYNNSVSIFWNAYLSMSVGAGEFTSFDPTLLPPLSELAARISSTLPVHHYWLTDALKNMGVDAASVSHGVEGLIYMERLLVSNALSHSIGAEQLSSAAFAQFHFDVMQRIVETTMMGGSMNV